MKTTLTELLEVAKLISPYAYIAGGFYKDLYNNEEPKDIDVFMVNQSNHKLVVAILEKHEETKAVKSKVAYKVGRFEVVRPLTVFKRRLWGKPEVVTASFDMSIAMVYIDKDGLHKVNTEIDEQILFKEFESYLYEGDEDRTEDRISRYEQYGYHCTERVHKEITMYQHFERQEKFRSKNKTSTRTNKSYSTGGY